MGSASLHLVTACLVFLFGRASSIPVVEKLYKCNDETGFCELQPLGGSVGDSQSVCLLTCRGTLWPAPNQIEVKHETATFCDVKFVGFPAQELFEIAENNFLGSIAGKSSSPPSSCIQSEMYLEIVLDSQDSPSPDYYTLTLDTDESYSLSITDTIFGAKAVISAKTFFGSRHALESLSQLITTMKVSQGDTATVNVVASNVNIYDRPAYPYRGVLLDLSRHYVSMSKIETIVRAMGYNKMNRLHLHISDTASFPLNVNSQPNMARYGSYGEEYQYSTEMLDRLTKFAKAHGVVIVPEIDTPSHVNEGWQWGALEEKGDFAICTTNWTATSLEPPGGHLNIANENVYPVLQDIYEYVISTFQYPDLYHIGGDEVVVGSDETYAACWNSSIYGTAILDKLSELGLSRDDEESFYYLWHTFTHRAADMVHSFYSRAQRTGKLILWGGNAEPDETVTYNMVARPDVVEELPPSDYIMEIWDDSSDSIAPSLVEKGYDVILANFDYVYLDCGQEGFTNPGGYWCNPYHEWFHIYQYMNDMQQKWNLPHNSKGRIIGSEVLLWGEENGDDTVEKKVWPRAAALAEALWSNPQDGWYAADPRMQLWRNKLVSRGISAEELQPLWCAQNGPYSCTIDAGRPQ